MSINKTKIRGFLAKYEGKIVLAVGLVLVAIIAFEAGTLQGQNWQQKPLVIEKTTISENVSEVTGNCSKTQNLASQNVQDGLVAGEYATKNCAYIGSKNSDKYHLPSCTWATRIKPENRVCFKDIEDAKTKGYVSASCLKK